jgi:hypothetical protein
VIAICGATDGIRLVEASVSAAVDIGASAQATPAIEATRRSTQIITSRFICRKGIMVSLVQHLNSPPFQWK